MARSVVRTALFLDIIHARKLLKEAQRPHSAEQTRAFVEQGALPIFVRLLQSPNDDVQQQAVRALGFIAGDSPQMRNYVLQCGGLQPILAVLGQCDKTAMLRDAACTLRTLCSGKPAPPFEWVAPTLGTLAKLVDSSDVEVLADVCWALSSLAYGPLDQITAVIDAGVCCRLVELLSHKCSRVQSQALRAVGNITSGDEYHKQFILECGALPSVRKLLSSSRQAMRKKSCWIITNITAGSCDQIGQVVSNDLVPPIIDLLQKGDFDIKNEAISAICNVSSGGSAEADYLIEADCLQPVVDLLDMSEERILANALQTLMNILQAGAEKQYDMGLAENPFVTLVTEAGAVPKIVTLLHNPNEDVYQKAAFILTNFFPLDLSEGVLPTPAEAEPLCEAQAVECSMDPSLFADGSSHDVAECSEMPSVFADGPDFFVPPQERGMRARSMSCSELPESSRCNMFGSRGQASVGKIREDGSELPVTDIFGEPVQSLESGYNSNIFGVAGQTVFGEPLPSTGSVFVFGPDAATGSKAGKGQGEAPIVAPGTPLQQEEGDIQAFAPGTPVQQQEGLLDECDHSPRPAQQNMSPSSDNPDDFVPEAPAPPDGSCSWEWPLTRQEKKTRVGALERNIQLMDQQLLLEELAELREFRECHDSAWKSHCKQRKSIG